MEVAVGSAHGDLVCCHLSRKLVTAYKATSSSTVILRREFHWQQRCQLRSSQLSPCGFVDQSHVQFYGGLNVEKKDLRKKKSFKKLSNRIKEQQLSAACGITTSEPPMDAALPQETLLGARQDLLMELADLKARMKEKKKQLKAQKKAQKKALKASKAKSMKAKSSSSSSSLSECSDSDCETVDMELLRRSQTKSKDAGTFPSLVHQEEVVLASLGQSSAERSDIDVLPLCGRKENSLGTIPSGVLAFREATTRAKIEVCLGGKCKKAGAQQLLASLQESIPSNAGVHAVPCKCMGKCGRSINVRVAKEDSNPQHHCHVAAGDAGTLLRHHFGIGHTPSSLPSFRTLPVELHRLSPQHHALTKA